MIPDLDTDVRGMHYANIRGQSSNGEYIYMVDPWYTSTVGGGSYYSVSRTTLINAIAGCDQGCQVVIY